MAPEEKPASEIWLKPWRLILSTESVAGNCLAGAETPSEGFIVEHGATAQL